MVRTKEIVKKQLFAGSLVDQSHNGLDRVQLTALLKGLTVLLCIGEDLMNLGKQQVRGQVILVNDLGKALRLEGGCI